MASPSSDHVLVDDSQSGFFQWVGTAWSDKHSEDKQLDKYSNGTFHSTTTHVSGPRANYGQHLAGC